MSIKPQSVNEKTASMSNKPSARLTGPQKPQSVAEAKVSAKLADLQLAQQVTQKVASMSTKPSVRLTIPLKHKGEKPASMRHKHSARLTRLQHSLHVEKSDTNMGSAVHYMSPASVTMTTLHPEDYGSLYDYYQYLQVPPGSYSGEYRAYSYYSSKSSSVEIHRLERTCAIIRPDAVYFEDVVIRKILQQGFHILQRRKIHLTPEQVSELYTQYYGTASFPFLVVSMSSGPVIVLCLACTDAVTKWRQLVRGTGTINCNWFLPKALRVRFGRHASMDNVLHASEDIDNADREVRFFFPQMILEPLLSTEPEVTDYLAIYVNPTLLNALVELCKKKPLEPLLFFAEWLLQNNPYQPKMKPEIARLPT